jgi:hypothetical protein
MEAALTRLATRYGLGKCVKFSPAGLMLDNLFLCTGHLEMAIDQLCSELMRNADKMPHGIWQRLVIFSAINVANTSDHANFSYICRFTNIYMTKYGIVLPGLFETCDGRELINIDKFILFHASECAFFDNIKKENEKKKKKKLERGIAHVCARYRASCCAGMVADYVRH